MFSGRTAMVTGALVGSILAWGCGGPLPPEQTSENRVGGKGDIAQESKAIIVTEDMEGAVVSARVGEVIEVRLSGNPTTGYGWETVRSSRSLPVSSSEFIADDPSLVGSGGTFVFVIKPDVFAAGGTHEFRFAYFRKWEGPEHALRELNVSVAVTPTCRPVLCELYCEYGFKVDETTGCPVCACLDPFACSQDADCVPAKADCCGCQMGGHSVAVNKAYTDLVEVTPEDCNLFPVHCLAVYMCHGGPACVDGQCSMPD